MTRPTCEERQWLGADRTDRLMAVRPLLLNHKTCNKAHSEIRRSCNRSRV